MAMPRKLRCRVESVTDHGGRVYTVELAPQTPTPTFHAGQFLHLTVDDYDPSGFWPESRVFSIASSPSERRRLRICYSVKGRYTQKMEKALKPGGEVWVKFPYGEFIISDSVEAVLLAGGTGISAFTAFVEALKPNQSKPVWLIYGAREPGLLLFKEMLLERHAAVPAFRLIFFTEAGTENLTRELTSTPRTPQCLPGRIAVDALWPQIPEAEKKTFYLAGPPVMLTMLGPQLKARGVAPERVRVDAWE